MQRVDDVTGEPIPDAVVTCAACSTTVDPANIDNLTGWDWKVSSRSGDVANVMTWLCPKCAACVRPKMPATQREAQREQMVEAINALCREVSAHTKALRELDRRHEFLVNNLGKMGMLSYVVSTDVWYAPSLDALEVAANGHEIRLAGLESAREWAHGSLWGRLRWLVRGV